MSNENQRGRQFNKHTAERSNQERQKTVPSYHALLHATPRYKTRHRECYLFCGNVLSTADCGIRVLPFEKIILFHVIVLMWLALDGLWVLTLSVAVGCRKIIGQWVAYAVASGCNTSSDTATVCKLQGRVRKPCWALLQERSRAS